jgi:hypothetical protein
MKSRHDLIAISRRNSNIVKQERRNRLFQTVLVIFFAGLLVGFVAWGLRQDAIKIHNVSVRGNEIIASKALSALLSESIDGVYAFFVPKNTVLFYPRAKTIAAVLSAYPRIETAEITTENFDTLVLSVKERNPEFVWCEPTAEKTKAMPPATPSCYFADASGYIFDRAPSFSAPVFFEVESPLVNEFGSRRVGPPIGNFILSEEALKKVAIFKDRLLVAGIETITLRVLPGEDYELRIKNGGKIIFNGKQDFDTVLENLSAALSVSDLNKAFEGALLQYIDLRFGNKVFYKLEK